MAAFRPQAAGIVQDVVRPVSQLALAGEDAVVIAWLPEGGGPRRCLGVLRHAAHDSRASCLETAHVVPDVSRQCGGSEQDAVHVVGHQLKGDALDERLLNGDVLPLLHDLQPQLAWQHPGHSVAHVGILQGAK